VAEDFQLLQNPFMFPVTEQELLTKQYEKLVDFNRQEFERYVHMHSSDKLLG
jgi:hypothetical protein